MRNLQDVHAQQHTPLAVARGSVRPSERALAPDLARGAMLLLIVMSNTAFHLWAATHGASGQHPVDGSALDRAVQFLMITVLDLRVYPLFAFLFGYGMMQLFVRQTAAGTSPRAAVALLRRRSLWLIVFGLWHAALLLAGDILSVYGMMSLLLGWAFLTVTPAPWRCGARSVSACCWCRQPQRSWRWPTGTWARWAPRPPSRPPRCTAPVRSTRWPRPAPA